jgi:hypothetical protein
VGRLRRARDDVDFCRRPVDLRDLPAADRGDGLVFGALPVEAPGALRDLFLVACFLVAASPARAPTTPPTAAPTGPAMLPIAAPATAPAVCFGIGGT